MVRNARIIHDEGLLDNVKTRQADFEFVTPTASADFLLTGIPVGATVTGCYAVVKDATSIPIGIVMRSRATPWTSAGQTVIVDVSTQTATTTGEMKTVASTTLAINNELRLITGTPVGSPGRLRVTLKYTID